MQPEDEKIISQFIDFFNCEIDNRLYLKVGMWKTFVSASDGEQLIVPMCFTSAWEPSGSWTEIWVWTGEYEENKERDVEMWFEAPISIIHEKVIQVKVVPSKFTDGPTVSSLAKGDRSFWYYVFDNWLAEEDGDGSYLFCGLFWKPWIW